MKASGRPGTGPAFTLVELLVVIGIIALLISVLLPALGAARRAAALTQCLAIQRQIGTAAQMHATQHRGYYPLAGALNGLVYMEPDAVGDATKQKYSYVFVEALNGGPLNRFSVAPWQLAIAAYMGKKNALLAQNNEQFRFNETGDGDYLRFFMCPSDLAKSADAKASYIVRGASLWWTIQQSYVVNEAIFGLNDTYGRLRGQASKIRNPSQTMLLMDGKEAANNPAAPSEMWVTLINRTPLTRTISQITLADALQGNSRAGSVTNFDKPRHRNKVNILFADGHAEARNIAAPDLTSVMILSR